MCQPVEEGGEKTVTWVQKEGEGGGKTKKKSGKGRGPHPERVKKENKGNSGGRNYFQEGGGGKKKKKLECFILPRVDGGKGICIFLKRKKRK